MGSSILQSSVDPPLAGVYSIYVIDMISHTACTGIHLDIGVLESDMKLQQIVYGDGRFPFHGGVGGTFPTN